MEKVEKYKIYGINVEQKTVITHKNVSHKKLSIF